MFEDSIQEMKTLTCEPFQLYFIDKRFSPNEISKLEKHNKLTKKTIETKYNKIFMLDQKDNENKIQQYMEQMNIQLELTN